MATTESRPTAVSPAVETVYVDRFCDGIIGPGAEVLGTVCDGGHIVANTAPGCWGPMITPAIQGGHEVTLPVNVEGAEVGDAIVIHIRSIDVTSSATASGNDRTIEGRFNGDPYCAKVCASCGAEDEATVVEGIGPDSVRCAACGAPAAPFAFTNGYTMAFDDARALGVTVTPQQAESFARDAAHAAALPANSVQNPILLFAPADLVGVVARMRPFLGQIGTMPSLDLPDSHNAGDFGAFLVGAPHRHAVTAEQLAGRTDGHLDIDAVRAGAILVCPVKVPGGGVYVGDMHAMQGDGEIAGHTADVAGTATLQVSVLKGLDLDGPILFPVLADVPFLAQPLTADERSAAEALAARRGGGPVERSLPVSFVGTGPDLNSAVDNGLARAAKVLGMSVPEVMNRATISGAIEIGRAPGTVQVTFRAPVEALAARGLDGLARQQYGEPA
ncbi:MAG TPA: acetamidase/formamidase family protein [Baekduia sp.]|uniref:acetamidase/formamidase family protein n=1 Tax=Baekduia sp. TaxID=2600305 RepID=UPI002B6B5F3F|nr:acetamidase/formamidase family protein [Baekduia sp.]HMJ36230.1 acetamidase/formamidase family protein [Baekduia sp.]